jgi:hypothetical protein
LKPGTPEIVVLDQPELDENVERDNEGVLGGLDVAVTLTSFVLDAPLGSLKVNVIV